MLDLAAGLARRAALAIEAVKRAGFAVERKTDESPVTEADRVAEALIVEALREATPAYPVVAEEEVEAGIVTAAGAPLLAGRSAGRHAGIRQGGADEFAVCIGLVEDGRPVLGAVALPATGEVFGGLLGAGAWKEDARRSAARSAPARSPAEGPVVLASRTYADRPAHAAVPRRHGAIAER